MDKTPKVTVFVGVKKYDRNSDKQQKINKLVSKFIVETCSPYFIVDYGSFHELISYLDFRCDLPGEKSFRTSIFPKLYDQLELKLKSIIGKELDAGCSLTFDFWKGLNKENFLEVTLTFIDRQFKLRTLAIGVVPFNEKGWSHSGLKIFKEIETLLEHYGVWKDSVEAAVTVCWNFTQLICYERFF